MIIMTTKKSVFSPYHHNPDDDDAGLGVTTDDNGDNEDYHRIDNMTTKMDLMDFGNQCATTYFFTNRPP